MKRNLTYFEAGPKCLKFWYHMYGSNMGTLSVLRNETQVWTKTGDQGNAWHRAELDLGTSAKNYKVKKMHSIGVSFLF